MNIHVAINGNHQAPQLEEVVKAKITAGDIPADALCWQEGWSDWRPVGQVYPELFSGDMPMPMAMPVAPANSQAIRNEHLSHEASVRSIGTLYLLGAIFLILAGVGSLISATQKSTSPEMEHVPMLMGIVLLGLGVMHFQIGRWLRRLNPKERTPATILAIFGLLGFPLGTLINAYILYLLRSNKGGTVFSPDYAVVIAATPQIKYKTSILVWILVALVLGGLVAAMIIPLLA